MMQWRFPNTSDKKNMFHTRMVSKLDLRNMWFHGCKTLQMVGIVLKKTSLKTKRHLLSEQKGIFPSGYIVQVKFTYRIET